MLDKPLSQHWNDCKAFGNLYGVSSDSHRLHFILFCRLMGWFHLNAVPPYREMKWRYNFERTSPPFSWVSDAETLMAFLREQVGVLGMRSVARAWTRGKVAGKGREEAMAFFEALYEAFGRVRGEGLVEEWETIMKPVRSAIGKW